MNISHRDKKPDILHSSPTLFPCRLFVKAQGSCKAVWQIALATASYWPESHLAHRRPILFSPLARLAAGLYKQSLMPKESNSNKQFIFI